jgi:chromosome segregation ATPase
MPIETITAGVTKAISIVETLRKVAKKAKDAEVNELLADLSLALSDVKMKLADSQTENADLKSKIFELNEEINSLRHRLSDVEEKKSKSGSQPWLSSQQKEQIFKILQAMAQAEGQRWKIEAIAAVADVGVSVAELITSDMDSWGLIYTHYNMIYPTSYTLSNDGRRALFDAGLIQ